MATNGVWAPTARLGSIREWRGHGGGTMRREGWLASLARRCTSRPAPPGFTVPDPTDVEPAGTVVQVCIDLPDASAELVVNCRSP